MVGQVRDQEQRRNTERTQHTHSMRRDLATADEKVADYEQYRTDSVESRV